MNQTIGYAIAALVRLAVHRGESALSNTAICEATGMPSRYVLQILRKLVQAGIVSSTRGINGGYRLAKPASQITLLDAWEAVEGPLTAARVDGAGFTPAAHKVMASTVGAATDDMRKRLASFTLDALRAAKT